MNRSVRRIVVSLWENRRLILYPEGGVSVEVHVAGIGWVVDDDEIDLLPILNCANSLVNRVFERVS